MQSIEPQRKASSDVMIDSVNDCLDRLLILVERASDKLKPVRLDISKLAESGQKLKQQYPPLMETVLGKCEALNELMDRLEHIIETVDL